MTSHLSNKVKRFRLLSLLGVAVSTTLLLAACSAKPAADSSAPTTDAPLTVTFALDYLPNPISHSGLAYALQSGKLASQGIDLEIVPYGATTSETLVSSGQADMGISGSNGLVIAARAAQAPITSVFEIMPQQPFELSVLADSGISRPADLAGKTLGTFGTPVEKATANAMVLADGGTSGMNEVVLNVGALDALKSGQVDAILSYPDNLYQFDQEGVKTTTFASSDFSLPNSTGAVVTANDSFRAEHPDVVRDVVAALQSGYEEAISDPGAVTAAILAQFPGEVDPGLAEFIDKLNASTLLPNAEGPVGTQDATKWQDYADWMIAQGILQGPTGDPITSFDAKAAFTNDYLPQ